MFTMRKCLSNDENLLDHVGYREECLYDGCQ